jgi:hypothetical protein
MSVFIRKNMLVASCTVTAADGTATQPSTMTCYLNYEDLSGVQRNASFPLTYNSDDNLWSGTWDSSASADGEVQWMIAGVGSVQVADQGKLQIAANQANTA